MTTILDVILTKLYTNQLSISFSIFLFRLIFQYWGLNLGFYITESSAQVERFDDSAASVEDPQP